MSVNQAFHELIDAKSSFLREVDNLILREHVAYALRGSPGKEDWGSQSRGLLVHFFNDEKPVLNRAIAIELLHNAALMIDDLIDKSELRRGSIAFWRRYGAETTILVVHIMISLAMKRLTCLPNAIPTEIINRIFLDIATMAMAELRAGRREIQSGTAYIAYAHAKTGQLFELAAALGLGPSSQSASMIKAIGRIGILHQVMDDALDERSDSSCKTAFGQCNWKILPQHEIEIVRTETDRIRDFEWPRLEDELRAFHNGDLISRVLRQVGHLSEQFKFDWRQVHVGAYGDRRDVTITQFVVCDQPPMKLRPGYSFGDAKLEERDA
jgi:hypothetical protein